MDRRGEEKDKGFEGLKQEMSCAVGCLDLLEAAILNF